MKDVARKAAVDIGKSTVANLLAFIFAAGSVTAAWVGMGGPLPASDVRVNGLEMRISDADSRIDDTQATYLGDKLLDYRREQRQIKRSIRNYENRSEEPPRELLDLRDNLDRQIYNTEQRLRKLGLEP